MSAHGQLLPREDGRPLPDRALARYRWPSEARHVPTRCRREHCGGTILGDAPSASYPLTEQVCSLCGHASHELVTDGLRRPIRPGWPT